MKRSRSIAVVTLALVFTAACIHKTGGAVTPWERLTTYNAALAEANSTVEQGAEAVFSSNLATQAQVSPIINASGQVGVLHLQVTAILQQGTLTQANVVSIKALVDTIKGAIAAMPPTALGIKNPKSQQAFSADLNQIGTLADAILASAQAVAK